VLRCSFCRKSEKEVSRLIAGAKAHICDDCVESSMRILEASPKAELGDGALLSSLRACDAAVDAAREVLQRRVELLRKNGVSWEAIGKALGVSRQSAWERFH
jgi:ATP-dependent protease Clp ATPase subunit